jgi:hypothetical protein
MAGQHDFNILLLMQHVEYLQDDPAWEREDGLHPFPFQTLDEDFSPCELHNRPPSPSANSHSFGGGNHLTCKADEKDIAPFDRSEASEKSRGKMDDPIISFCTRQ